MPAGGGTKEMLVRAMSAAADAAERCVAVRAEGLRDGGLGEGLDQRARGTPARIPRRDRCHYDEPRAAHRRRQGQGARARARRLREAGGAHAIPVGGASLGAALKLGVHLAWRAGRASDHDALVGRKVAHIFAGGDLPHATTVSEQHLLDLERAAFLSLLGERKTLERIQHTLKTGKPLRN